MYLLPLCLDAKRVYTVEHSVQNFLRLQVTYGVFTRSSKRPALARVFWIHLLEVYWTFAGSCKHPIKHKRKCCANVSV